MEDPIRFDVHAKFTEPSVGLPISQLVSSGAYKSELQARKAMNKSRQTGEHVLVARSQGWSQAVALTQCFSAASDPRITQEGYIPSEAPNYCAEHHLYYGGCLGCHVCGAFYAA